MLIACRWEGEQVLGEAERSLHDALCVVRCLVTKRFLIAGGGAPEIEGSLQLGAYAKTLQGMESYCVKAFAEAMEVRILSERELRFSSPCFHDACLESHHYRQARGAVVCALVNVGPADTWACPTILHTVSQVLAADSGHWWVQVIPYTLAENAGLNPIAIVTELRNRHANAEVSVRDGIGSKWCIFKSCSP